MIILGVWAINVIEIIDDDVFISYNVNGIASLFARQFHLFDIRPFAKVYENWRKGGKPYYLHNRLSTELSFCRATYPDCGCTAGNT